MTKTIKHRDPNERPEGWARAFPIGTWFVWRTGEVIKIMVRSSDKPAGRLRAGRAVVESVWWAWADDAHTNHISKLRLQRVHTQSEGYTFAVPHWDKDFATFEAFQMAITLDARDPYSLVELIIYHRPEDSYYSINQLRSENFALDIRNQEPILWGLISLLPLLPSNHRLSGQFI